MKVLNKMACFLALFVLVLCKTEELKNESEHIHTIHHHHVQKYEVIKKVEVPIIKEVKVPYYVYVPIKYPYTYTVKPFIVKVPIEYYNTQSDEHGHVKVIPPHEDHEEHSEHHDHTNEDANHQENFD
ncbi:unnamed protein product [Chironomus riparius]|uniref:Uncharacterized protein n=1 Tax=Chironomus riparius TaxID=315576 RepID=A0A9N9RJG7_9DIPT|nr:unnamed protein product [Chironomus riparius]